MKLFIYVQKRNIEYNLLYLVSSRGEIYFKAILVTSGLIIFSKKNIVLYPLIGSTLGILPPARWETPCSDWIVAAQRDQFYIHIFF